MARTGLSETNIDLNKDTGSVLWSLIQGEQLEYLVTLNFLADIKDYEFEAVSLEALNVAQSLIRPVTLKPGGIETALEVRVPYTPDWVAGTYLKDDIVYSTAQLKYYKVVAPISTAATIPHADWEEYVNNKVYINIPTSLSLNYAVQPIVGFPIYSFFELRVTMAAGALYNAGTAYSRNAIMLYTDGYYYKCAIASGTSTGIAPPHANWAKRGLRQTWKPMRGMMQFQYSPTEDM